MSLSIGSAEMRAGRVLIIGAGAAGLSAASDLAVDHRVMVVDKGRGVGGRMATRRVGGATFDHGAQFFTTRDGEFTAIVQRWLRSGVVRRWYHGRVGPAGIEGSDGHERYRGTVSMNAVAKHLAEGLDVRCSSRVVDLEPVERGWSARLDGGGRLEAAAVVVTAPVPQVIDLLGAGCGELDPGDRDALRRISYDPCIAVMAVLDRPAELPAPGAVAPAVGPVDWIADNHAKGISAAPALTVHAGALTSATLWEEPDDRVVDEIMAAARAATGRPLVACDHSVQRWRFARPSVSHPEPCLVVSGVPPLVVAGDAFGGAMVEGAVRSGLAAARAVRQALSR
jgi:renalase